MSLEQFYNDCLAVPWEDPMPKELVEIAQDYYERTESFDRTVCSGPIVNGSIRPANNREYRIIAKNAYKVRKELLSKAFSLGFSPKEFTAALKIAIKNHE